ncbi:MAG: hypothetical protein A2Z24_01255 [Candidatus Woykebacteria bacterium RBG_16_44_10]|uniref:Uncharacterized protein n=1 Tax=Candidatus Woykebacteria bacterium RBG_16_44_10 TaxID=1802597 RepID=A0A1G1WFB1_9BACT|nr:MAG: hypothetical protein A2Z24_01255 [Candidatus Woykebacteria bacterium RBG_16_44_10]
MGLLAIVSANIVSNVLRSQNKTNIVNEVRQNGDLVIDKFERDVKQASGITQISSTNVELDIGGTAVGWDCTGNSFTRDGVSVTSTEPITGVQIVDTPAHLCEFVVTGTGGAGIPQIVKLDFTLEQRNTASASELQSQVPFSVTVGTRAYTTN